MGETGSGEGSTVAGRPEDITAVPVRHPVRWVAAAVVLLIAASLVNSAVGNPRIGWSVVGEYLFDPRILDGVLMTIELTIACMAAGVVLGIVAAVMKLSPNPVISSVAWFYIWFFRGLPRYVLLLFFFSISALYPAITVGIPFAGQVFLSFNANNVFTAFAVAFVALSLSEGAYMAEIVRGGLLAVDEGQDEAARALGLSRLQILRHVTLPQAMRVIVPPTGNETISMLKDTSLVFAASLTDLMYSAQLIIARTYKPIPLYVVVIIWYLALTSVLYVIQYYLERRFGRGTSKELPPTPRQRVLDLWRKWRPRPEVAA